MGAPLNRLSTRPVKLLSRPHIRPDVAVTLARAARPQAAQSKLVPPRPRPLKLPLRTRPTNVARQVAPVGRNKECVSQPLRDGLATLRQLQRHVDRLVRRRPRRLLPSRPLRAATKPSLPLPFRGDRVRFSRFYPRSPLAAKRFACLRRRPAELAARDRPRRRLEGLKLARAIAAPEPG